MQSRRRSLTRAETIDVLRFIGDVAAHKADPIAQRAFLVEGLIALAGLDFGFVYTGDGWRPGGTPRLRSSVNPAACDALYADYAADVIVPGGGIHADPFCAQTLHRDGPIVSVSIPDVLPDRETRLRHDPFIAFGRQVKMGDGVVSFARLDRPGDAIFGVGLHRADAGRRKVTARQRTIVNFAVAEAAALIARGHLATPELDVDGEPIDPADGLPPRPRAVLRRMLRGHNPKAIARELGIGVYTVREYQQAIYRHFQVNGRDELMARFVRP